MSLSPCRECGKQISTEAPSCPQCGTPHPAKATLSSRRRWLYYAAGTLALLAVLLTFRYDVHSCPKTNRGNLNVSCIILDRWTGAVQWEDIRASEAEPERQTDTREYNLPEYDVDPSAVEISDDTETVYVPEL